MSFPTNKSGAPRKIRRDDRLKSLPVELRAKIKNWHVLDGWQSCLRRIASELGITVSRTSFYDAIAYWKDEETHPRKLSIRRPARRDALLLNLPEEQRAQVVKWMAGEGANGCAERIKAELGITVSATQIYVALERWREAHALGLSQRILKARAEAQKLCDRDLTWTERDAITEALLALLTVEGE